MTGFGKMANLSKSLVVTCIISEFFPRYYPCFLCLSYANVLLISEYNIVSSSRPINSVGSVVACMYVSFMHLMVVLVRYGVK